jgi:hypothetical protein
MDGWHGQSNDYPAPKKRNFFDSIRHLFGAH